MFTTSRKAILAATVSILLALSSVAFASRAKAIPVQSAPVEFSMRSLEGQTVTSSSLRGEVVVLAFGANWLPLSRKQVQGVRKLADNYAGRGVVVYWVSTDSESSKSKNFASDDQLHDFARRNDLNVTILRDPDGEISRRMGVDQVPSFVILDKQGNIFGQPIRGFDPNGDLIEQIGPEIAKLL